MANQIPKQGQSNTLELSLDELLPEPAEKAPRPPACVVGECLDDRHPTLQGRVLVRWPDGKAHHERWCATLQGLPVRRGDHLLLLRPQNGDEHLVTGVVSGFSRRAGAPTREAARLELKRDEVVRIAGHEGQDLLEIRQGAEGPVVTLLHEDLELRVPGKLSLRGDEIHLEAEAGRVQVKASDDVVVLGETIQLN